MGYTLDLDCSPRAAFAEKVYDCYGSMIQPSDESGHLTMVVSFSRHSFRLNEGGGYLEATIGGYVIDLPVSCIKERVFSFNVSCKQVGFIILDLRSYSYP